MTATRPVRADHEDAGDPPAETGSAAARLVRRLPYLAVLVLASVLFLYPFVWLASASLKP
ncbi:MAG: carbohydrate ABC transporter permease, partial [Actinobacteria bacterium]|nr:carbohydrate ABC transporter permease [Actinomycetota bacterium]